MLRSSGHDWNSLEKVSQLRHQLLELDTRFSQLGRRGVFESLDQAGALNHTLLRSETIEVAKREPPAFGRPFIRGECVRRFQAEKGRFSCNWTGVWDRSKHRYLDLSDPFVTNAKWKEYKRCKIRRDAPDPEITIRLAEAHQAYSQGAYETAYQELHVASMLERDREQEYQRLRLLAKVQSRRGWLHGVELLQTLSHDHHGAFWLISDYVVACRFWGLVPSVEMSKWVRDGLEYLSRHPDHDRERGHCNARALGVPTAYKQGNWDA